MLPLAIISHTVQSGRSLSRDYNQMPHADSIRRLLMGGAERRLELWVEMSIFCVLAAVCDNQ